MSDGLRERKKQATRQAISDSATALFMQKGFDNTTFAEVAEHAGVSLQTVINYFPQKTDLFFDEVEWLDGPGEAIRQRRADQTPSDAVHAWYVGFLQRRHAAGHLQGVPDYLHTIDESPTLRRRRLEDIAALTEAIAEALRESAPADTASWQTALQAAALTSILTVAESEVAQRIRNGRARDALKVAEAAATEVFGSGLLST